MIKLHTRVAVCAFVGMAAETARSQRLMPPFLAQKGLRLA